MRSLIVFVLGCFLVAAPVRSAVDFPPPTEPDIEARIKALQQQQEELRAKEQQLKKELSEAKEKPFGGVRAEVQGILKREDPGFCIIMRTVGGQEQRVWIGLMDPKTFHAAGELLGRGVVVTGNLFQGPILPYRDPHSSPSKPYPANAMWLDLIKIEELAQKTVTSTLVPAIPSLPSEAPAVNPK